MGQKFQQSHAHPNILGCPPSFHPIIHQHHLIRFLAHPTHHQKAGQHPQPHAARAWQTTKRSATGSGRGPSVRHLVLCCPCWSSSGWMDSMVGGWGMGWIPPRGPPPHPTPTNPTERVKPDGNFWGRFIKPTALSFPGAVYAVDFSPVGAFSNTHTHMRPPAPACCGRYVCIHVRMPPGSAHVWHRSTDRLGWRGLSPVCPTHSHNPTPVKHPPHPHSPARRPGDGLRAPRARLGADKPGRQVLLQVRYPTQKKHTHDACRIKM